MLNILLFGPPGAGKGTQSEKVLKKYNLLHLLKNEENQNQIKKNKMD